LIVFYLLSVGALIVGAFVLGSGVLASLPGIGGLTSGITTASRPAAAPVLSQGGGSVATDPSINSRQSSSPQGGVLTSWTSPAFYIVQRGDTLQSIADRFGTTRAALKQYNPNLSDNIIENQVIFLPPVYGDVLPGTGRNSNP
jgi:LysM repeat protein